MITSSSLQHIAAEKKESFVAMPLVNNNNQWAYISIYSNKHSKAQQQKLKKSVGQQLLGILQGVQTDTSGVIRV